MTDDDVQNLLDKAREHMNPGDLCLTTLEHFYNLIDGFHKYIRDLIIPLSSGIDLENWEEEDDEDVPEPKLHKNTPDPWHPEYEKPDLPFLICTDGKGHYWIGRYFLTNKVNLSVPPQLIGEWQTSNAFGFDGGWTAGIAPVAWCDPREFVPYEKPKELHVCSLGTIACVHEKDAIAVYNKRKLAIRCEYCPLCGKMYGEK